MSEVKRFKVDTYRLDNPATSRVLFVVDADDYDAKCHAADVYFGSWKRTEEERDTALSQLAALRGELASLWETVNNTIDKLGIDCIAAQSAPGKPSDVLVAHVNNLQQHLADAERRNAELEALRNPSDKELIEIARNAALNSCQRYAYLPSLAEDLYAWNPHWWVIEAMRAALTKPEEAKS